MSETVSTGLSLRVESIFSGASFMPIFSPPDFNTERVGDNRLSSVSLSTGTIEFFFFKIYLPVTQGYT